MGLREMGKWPPEQTLKFAELYHGHECLWNQNKPEYKNKVMRKMAIKDIINQMAIPNFGEADVKCKIKNLRSTYFQEVQKIKQSAMHLSDGQRLYEPTIEWFDVFDSLMQSSSGYASAIEDSLYGEEILPGEICDSSIPDQCSEDPMSFPEESPFTSTPSNSSENPTIFLEAQSTVERPNTRTYKPQFQRNLRNKAHRRNQRVNEVPSKRKRTPVLSPNNYCHSEQDMSENEAFGRYIVKSLNNLSALSSALAQQEIQGVLTKFKLKETERGEVHLPVETVTFEES